MLRPALALCIALPLAACATISAEDRALLAQDIDCERAEETMEAIREARPTDLDRARVLASTLTLGGLAYGAVTNDLHDREALMSGAYDDQLNARIREIARACDVPAPELEEEAGAA